MERGFIRAGRWETGASPAYSLPNAFDDCWLLLVAQALPWCQNHDSPMTLLNRRADAGGQASHRGLRTRGLTRPVTVSRSFELFCGGAPLCIARPSCRSDGDRSRASDCRTPRRGSRPSLRRRGSACVDLERPRYRRRGCTSGADNSLESVKVTRRPVRKGSPFMGFNARVPRGRRELFFELCVRRCP
jgi:hypothetical protein